VDIKNTFFLSFYAQRKEVSSLPSWWPLPNVAPVVSADEYKSAQFQANTLLKGLFLLLACQQKAAFIITEILEARVSFLKAV
jgi:hypothetical protein